MTVAECLAQKNTVHSSTLRVRNVYSSTLRITNRNDPLHQLNTSPHMARDFVEMVDQSHYSDVIMGTMASQITSLTIVYSTVYSGTDQRKHQSSVSLVFVRRIHRWPVNSPHKGPVTREMFSIWWRHHSWIWGSLWWRHMSVMASHIIGDSTIFLQQ